MIASPQFIISRAGYILWQIGNHHYMVTKPQDQSGRYTPIWESNHVSFHGAKNVWLGITGGLRNYW